ncbi:MAG: CDP-alcohol phosphatidyltransferase family protein [Candidatus Aenigmarchaeota archaeon]|nr:CDP-alcohol phosphatidyltransferase family protein [Candidatus Aenigmarchaeota archaeon]
MRPTIKIMLYAKRHVLAPAELAIGKAFSFLSPNTWTLLSIAFAIASAFFLSQRTFLAGGLLLAATAFLDLIDGSVARYLKKATVRGAYLDTIMDRYVEGIIIISLLFAGLPDYVLSVPAWLMIYLFGSFMTTYAKAALAEKAQLEVKGGLLERAERMLILIAGVFFASLDVVYLSYAVIALSVLTNISALQRIYAGIRKINE